MQARAAHPARKDAAPSVEQLDALTSLRFLAAFFVVLFHFAFLFPGTLENIPGIRLGYTGVTFFFILSGFILAHNYANVDLGERQGRRAYLSARIARIAPVFLLSLVVGLPGFAVEQAKNFDTGLQLLAMMGLVLAPLGIHAWVPGAACSINCPSWSISAELFFYMMLPFVLAPIMRRPLRYLAAVAAIWVALAVLAAVMWSQLGEGRSVIDPHSTLALAAPAQFLKHFPLLRLPEFLLGIAVYALWKQHANAGTHRLALLALPLGAMAIFVMLPHVPEIVLHNGLTALFWVPLIVWAAGSRSGLLHTQPAMFLGRISYALYLLHLPIGLMIAEYAGSQPGAVLATTPMLALALATTAVLSASTLVFLWIEEPCRRLISRWLIAPSKPPAIADLPGSARA